MAEKNLPARPADVQVGDFLKSFGKSLNDYAIRKYNPTAFLKSAMLAIMESPDLREAVKTDAGKASLFNALRFASTTGLSLNPQEGKAALIAYSGKIQYQVMKNGMIDLALESGKVEFVTADYVRENDKFTMRKTAAGDEYIHEPALRDRGGILGYYAALKLRGGATHVKWFTSEEVGEHRKKYSQRSQMPETGYGVKTVMKALLRSISISTDLDAAIGADDHFEITAPEPGTSADEAAAAMSEPKKTVEPAESTGSLL